MTRKTDNGEPQQNNHLGTVSYELPGDLHKFLRSQPHPQFL